MGVLAESRVIESAMTAEEWYRRAAQRDVAIAQYYLGITLQKRGFDRWPEAETWLQKAAEAGIGEAANALAAMYSLGYTNQNSEASAVEWLKRARSLGDTSACAWLGQFYLTDERRKNSDLAEAYLREGTDLGDALSKAILGDLLIERPNQLQQREGIQLILEAADNGVSSALRRLSELYSTGRFGFPVDAEKATEYSEKFAEALKSESNS
jgi:TPR repeat protein